MLLIFERAKLGEIFQCSCRYAKANNKCMGKKFHENKNSVLIRYLDGNNLYGWATCIYFLPYEDFNRKNSEYFVTIRILKRKNDQIIGHLFDLYLKYPEKLHDKYSHFLYVLRI